MSRTCRCAIAGCEETPSVFVGTSVNGQTDCKQLCRHHYRESKGKEWCEEHDSREAKRIAAVRAIENAKQKAEDDEMMPIVERAKSKLTKEEQDALEWYARRCDA